MGRGSHPLPPPVKPPLPTFITLVIPNLEYTFYGLAFTEFWPFGHLYALQDVLGLLKYKAITDLRLRPLCCQMGCYFKRPKSIVPCVRWYAAHSL